MKVLLFCLCNIIQCRGLHLNKAAHWTELSVRLAFRIAVNAFLLMRLLKVPSPCKKSMWGEYNADPSDTAKGHCIRKPYLCCVTFGCARELGWIPADTVSSSWGEPNRLLYVGLVVQTSKWHLIVFFIYTFECSAWEAEAPTSTKCTALATPNGWMGVFWLKVWKTIFQLYKVFIKHLKCHSPHDKRFSTCYNLCLHARSHTEIYYYYSRRNAKQLRPALKQSRSLRAKA